MEGTQLRNKVLAGYIINLLMMTYLALGVSVVLRHSVPLGILYVVIILVSFVAIAYAFCAKCACRHHSCTHLWLGKLAQLLPPRKPGPYTFWDGMGQMFYIAGLQLFPQYWLWQNKVLFALFWGLSLATFLVGPLYACKGCENKYCYLNRDTDLA